MMIGVKGKQLCAGNPNADGQTDMVIPVYPPNFVAGGIIIITQGVGEGGSRGLCPALYKVRGAQVGLWPPTFGQTRCSYFVILFPHFVVKNAKFSYFTLLRFFNRIKILRPSGPNYWENVEWIPYVFCKEY